MNLNESIRRYILLGIVGFIILGVIVANFKANGQDEQFLLEDDLFQQASQMASTGNYDEAAKYIKDLLKLQPDSEEVNYLGGIIATNLGDFNQSAILLQKTLDLNPYLVENAVFMLQLGESLYKAERYEDAKIVLTRCQEAGWAPEEIPNYQTLVTELLNSIEKMS